MRSLHYFRYKMCVSIFSVQEGCVCVWLLLDYRRGLWTKDREGPWSVEWDESVPSSLDAGSAAGGPIKGSMARLPDMPALAPSQL